ncbi:MAG TPA: dihydropteroate synthase [Candidatus Acidoferrales bacterium]|nr:dihydropteroate synthase [Candidatus Acidoferrales bacterium]
MVPRKRFRLRLPSRTLILGERTLIMGVLNVTPDSFSDGGKFLDAEKAIEHALEMERKGADILDIGGESTRPGSTGITAEEELRRVLPVIQGLRGRLKIPLSIDTQKAEVAEAVIAAGAEILNVIGAVHAEAEIFEIARRRGVATILMHMRGRPQTMQKGPFAKNVVQDVMTGLRSGITRARHTGIAKSKIIVDPGIGFGKRHRQSLELIARLPELAKLGYPVLVGVSRKAFIGDVLGGVATEQRGWGTAAAVAASIFGGAHIVRVHDVDEMKQVARVADRILALPRKHA